MFKKIRIPLAAITIMLAHTTAMVSFSGAAAARGGNHDKSSMQTRQQKVASQGQQKHERHGDKSHDQTHTKRMKTTKHAKNPIECIKAPCPTNRDRHTKHRHKHAHDRKKGKITGTTTAKGCGKLIVPTAGCPTPTRNPVGNTVPSLPKEAKQPTAPVRQPVIFHDKKIGPQSAKQPPNAATVAGTPANNPAGNTRPIAGSNLPTAVTVSNGVTTTQIQNGLGGVSVYSDKPGRITVTNGKE